MRRIATALLLGVVLAAAWVTASLGHPERATTFPNRHVGSVPRYRTSGPMVVVCRPDSAARVRRSFAHERRTLRARLRLLRRCRYQNIQAAVNAARTGDRIELMPGVYRELPSRRVRVGAYHQPPCANDYVVTEGFNNAPPPVGP